MPGLLIYGLGYSEHSMVKLRQSGLGRQKTYMKFTLYSYQRLGILLFLLTLLCVACSPTQAHQPREATRPNPTAAIENQNVPTRTVLPRPTINPIPTPAAPPQGRIVFLSNRDGYTAIYSMNIDGTHVIRLTDNDMLPSGPAPSPNGTRIAFNAQSDLYVMNSDGSHMRRIAPNPAGLGTCPTWSPDGKRIAFKVGNEIHTIAPDGTNQHVVRLMDQYGCGMAWSPDGAVIAYRGSTIRNQSTLAFLALDNENPDPIASYWGGFGSGAASWSPDGTHLVTIVERERPWNDSHRDHFDMYTVSRAGTDQERVTSGNAPAWSPDGSRLVFSSQREGNSEIYIINSDGTDLQRITQHPADDGAPVWIPEQ